MGTLMGHIVPGTFFGLFAIWWGFCVAVKHFHSRHATKKSRKPIPYRSSATFACLCCPSAALRHVPLESYMKLICVIIGIMGEAVTGLKHPYNEALQRRKWIFVEVNAQHITMFFSFGFAAVFEILVHFKYEVPHGIEYLANTVAFTIEGFLFHFHLHGRNEIDIHVHTLLVYAISFCVLASIWEYNRPDQILATYARIAATFLQGAWFYAAGFILYFPSVDPYWTWQPNHSSILIITVIFIWLALFIAIFLLLQSAIIWCILKRRYRNFHYRVLNNDDDDEQYENSNNHNNHHPLKSLPSVNNSSKAIVDIDDDDDDNNSQIEFEQQQKQYVPKT